MPRWSKLDSESLIKLRQLLSNDDNNDNIILLKNQIQFPELLGDRRLLRYIRGAKYDINQAKKNFFNTLRFRVEHKVNAIRNDIVFGGKNCPNKFPNGLKILSYFKTIILSSNHRDIDGNPISYEDFSSLPSALIANVTREEYVNFMIYCLEYKSLLLEQLSEETERNIINNRLNDNTDSNDPYGTILFNTFIRNFNGLGWDHISNGQTIVTWVLEIAQNHYPEILQESHMINVPFIFEIIWACIKPFLDSQTLNKVKFYGTDFQSQLLKRVTVENFPSDLDSNGTLTMDVNNTPFIFDINPNGPLYYLGQPEQMNNNGNININNLINTNSTVNIKRIDSDCYLASKTNDNNTSNKQSGSLIYNNDISNTSIFGNSIFRKLSFKRNKKKKQHGLSDRNTDSTTTCSSNSSSSDSNESSDYINDSDDDSNLNNVMDNNNNNNNNDNDNDSDNNNSNNISGDSSGLVSHMNNIYLQLINYDFVSDFLLIFIVLADSLVSLFSGKLFCKNIGKKEIFLKSPKTWILYIILVLLGKLDYYASLSFRLCDHLKNGVLKVIRK